MRRAMGQHDALWRRARQLLRERLPDPERRLQHLGKGGLAARVQIEDRLVRLCEIGQPRPPGMELHTALIRQPE